MVVTNSPPQAQLRAQLQGKLLRGVVPLRHVTLELIHQRNVPHVDVQLEGGTVTVLYHSLSFLTATVCPLSQLQSFATATICPISKLQSVLYHSYSVIYQSYCILSQLTVYPLSKVTVCPLSKLQSSVSKLQSVCHHSYSLLSQLVSSGRTLMMTLWSLCSSSRLSVGVGLHLLADGRGDGRDEGQGVEVQVVTQDLCKHLRSHQLL